MEKFWVPSSPKFLQVMVNIYRPQRSCGKVIFSQASVSHSVHRGVYPSMHWGQTPPLGRHPPGQTTPWADTPLGRHPLWVDTTQVHPRAATLPPPPAIAADDTHPTGMNSYFDSFDKTESGKN